MPGVMVAFPFQLIPLGVYKYCGMQHSLMALTSVEFMAEFQSVDDINSQVCQKCNLSSTYIGLRIDTEHTVAI